MRQILILFSFVTLFLSGCSEKVSLPSGFGTTFSVLGLDKTYQPEAFLSPAYLLNDFNGDGVKDLALLVAQKASGKRGVLLMHGKSRNYFVFGAGTPFGNGGDDFKWADKWALYKEKLAHETQFDADSGDILGSKEIPLTRPALLIEAWEDGAPFAGGVVYWNGNTYTWIHQGE